MRLRGNSENNVQWVAVRCSFSCEYVDMYGRKECTNIERVLHPCNMAGKAFWFKVSDLVQTASMSNCFVNLACVATDRYEASEAWYSVTNTGTVHSSLLIFRPISLPAFKTTFMLFFDDIYVCAQKNSCQLSLILDVLPKRFNMASCILTTEALDICTVIDK